MRLNTVKKTGTLRLDGPPATGPLDLRHGRSLQAMLRATAEIERIRALQKPSHKSHARAQFLQEMLVTALGVDSFAAAEQALALAQRQRVASSIKTLLDRAGIREKQAAKKRAREEVQEARRQARERKDDTRRKIIVGGTIIAAIRDKVPATLAILNSIQARLPVAKWQFVEPVFIPSDDEKFLAEFLQEKPPDVAALVASGEVGKGQLVTLYHETEAKIEKALDLSQTWNGIDQRRQRAADARRKITVGGAVLASIREADVTAPALLQLLDERVVSVRDRDAVRVVLRLAEFRPRGRT